MPTYEQEGLFAGDYRSLSPQQRRLFLAAVRLMVADLRAKQGFRPSLRIKGVQGYPGIFEMTWDMPDGRATFRYGQSQQAGESHIIWRRVGGHDIFKNP
jgi:hypothetical protein